MKIKIFLLLICVFFLSGCAAVLIGGGVIGGMAVGKDTVKSGVEAGFDRTWNASLDEVKKVAEIKIEDKKHGIIEATSIGGETITIKIREITPRACEILVKSRKNLLPNITLAHDLSSKIVNRAR